MIESADINDNKRACKINRAEMDTRMRAIGDPCQNGEKIKARGRVYRQSEGGWGRKV